MKLFVAVASTLCLTINMSFWSSLLSLAGLIRLVIPLKNWKNYWTSVTILIGEACISCNSGWIDFLHHPSIEIMGMESIDKNNWYIATSNHQSWSDIFILQKVTN